MDSDLTKTARERFAADIFATEAAGIVIEKAERDYALCSMKLDRRHFNANGQVMGGALFTLADFAFAVAANTDRPVTVSLTSKIDFIGTVKGDTLYAETSCLKSGRGTAVMEIVITDNTERMIAKVSTTGYRMTPSASAQSNDFSAKQQ